MTIEVLIAALLVLLLAAIVWIGVTLKRSKRSNEAETLLQMQRETDSLRQELNESITNNMALVGQQISQTSSNVNESLAQVTAQVNEQLTRITGQVNEQLSGVSTQLQSSTGQINERMDNAARVVSEVSKSLGELGKATEQVFAVGKDIAGLQEILRAPKLRGELGEYFLGDLLEQILPSTNYQLQYSFKGGARVDAVVKLSNGIVPIDSKFPLENFRKILKSHSDEEKKAARRKFIKDVKGRIDEIASSYILPDEGTFNFALMYVPAENVYYETIIKDEDFGDEKQLASYAFSKRVVPVSPNSFYAYLQTILLGLRGLEISKQAKAMLSHIESLTNDFKRFREDFDVLGKHVSNTRSKYEEAQKKIERFDEKLTGIGAGEDDSLEEPKPKGASLSLK